MKIQDFCDMNKFEQIMKNWANSTGLATVAVGADGKYISDCYNFTEFCIDLTRGSAEGKKRCEQCDREGHGVYPCHAGLVDFGIPITLEDGTVLGSIIGGQVLPENPDEEKFRQTARELGIDEDKYIKALKKVNVKTKEQIDASANLLGDVINMFVRASYANWKNEMLELLTELSRVKREYDRLADALASVRATGYGVVGPGPEELKLEKPEVLKKNGSYGVKLRAMAPSIHMIRVDVDTEISPMVGGEEQSKELIEYLGGQEPEKLWQSNIFGKSVYDLIQEGLNAKLLRLPEDVRTKFRGTLGRIVNEGATGLVCLIL